MGSDAQSFNPEYDPTGVEGGVDTNKIPWLKLDSMGDLGLKPLRASIESGFFSTLVQIKKGTVLNGLYCFGGCDLLVLSGAVDWVVGGEKVALNPGIWGYLHANLKTDTVTAIEDTEILLNSCSALAFLDASGGIKKLLTSMDLQTLAHNHRLALVPSTLANCIAERPDPFTGNAEPLAIAAESGKSLVVQDSEEDAIVLDSPYFVDTRAVPWVSTEALPDVGLKILRVSEETGFISLIVKHNGVASPHTHLGASDFLVLNGRIGYRTGPPEGYGPGVWFYEPPGARHEATQRVNDEDLIYTANLYGPIAFDTGKGTPIVGILSWVEYGELAKQCGAKLVSNHTSSQKMMLAWAPIAV